MISFKDFINLSEEEKSKMTQATLGSFTKKNQAHAKMHQVNIDHQLNKAVGHKVSGRHDDMHRAYKNAAESRKIKSNIMDRLGKALSK